MQGGKIMSQLIQVLRKASPQRTISLWRDQEERIERLSRDLGIKLKYTDIVREGVDKLLEEIERAHKIDK